MFIYPKHNVWRQPDARCKHKRTHYAVFAMTVGRSCSHRTLPEPLSCIGVHGKTCICLSTDRLQDI